MHSSTNVNKSNNVVFIDIMIDILTCIRVDTILSNKWTDEQNDRRRRGGDSANCNFSRYGNRTLKAKNWTLNEKTNFKKLNAAKKLAIYLS